MPALLSLLNKIWPSKGTVALSNMMKGLLFFYEEVYGANVRRRLSFYMTFHQVSYVLYIKSVFKRCDRCIFHDSGGPGYNFRLEQHMRLNQAWNKNKNTKNCHGFLKTNPNCLCFREEKVGKCCGLMKSEVKPAKQIVKNGKILNFYMPPLEFSKFLTGQLEIHER